MSAELPPFSGDAPSCIKCAYEGANTTYRDFGQCVHGSGLAEVIGVEQNERLHRECARCGYEWDEAVITHATEGDRG